MIQLTEKLAMIADRNCYIVGEVQQKEGEPPTIRSKNAKYYSTAAQAVKGALALTMRQAVEENEVTNLREFIQMQDRLLAELDALVSPLEGERRPGREHEGRSTWQE